MLTVTDNAVAAIRSLTGQPEVPEGAGLRIATDPERRFAAAQPGAGAAWRATRCWTARGPAVPRQRRRAAARRQGARRHGGRAGHGPVRAGPAARVRIAQRTSPRPSPDGWASAVSGARRLSRPHRRSSAASVRVAGRVGRRGDQHPHHHRRGRHQQGPVHADLVTEPAQQRRADEEGGVADGGHHTDADGRPFRIVGARAHAERETERGACSPRRRAEQRDRQ